jgi:hypothetical protein
VASSSSAVSSSVKSRIFSGERRAANRKPGGLRYGLGNCT